MNNSYGYVDSVHAVSIDIISSPSLPLKKRIHSRPHSTNISFSPMTWPVVAKDTACVTSSSGPIKMSFVTKEVSIEEGLIDSTGKDLFDAIDREIAAMTIEELIAEIRASAGAWADVENLTDDGFTDTKWFRDPSELDNDGPNNPPIGHIGTDRSPSQRKS